MFRNLHVRVWSVSCVIGLGRLLRAFNFFFLSYRPLAQCWARGCPFCSSVCFSSVPPTPPTQYGAMVWVIGPLTEVRDCRFFVFVFFVVLPTPSSAPSRGAVRVIWLLTQWHRTARFVFFPCDARCFVFSFDTRYAFSALSLIHI